MKNLGNTLLLYDFVYELKLRYAKINLCAFPFISEMAIHEMVQKIVMFFEGNYGLLGRN